MKRPLAIFLFALFLIAGKTVTSQSTVCWMMLRFPAGTFVRDSGFAQTVPLCKGDTLFLAALGGPGLGVYTVTPTTGIDIFDSLSIKVFPSVTTVYVIRRTVPNVCYVEARLRVNVIGRAEVTAMADTTVCKGRSVQLRAASNVNNYWWQPASLLYNATAKEPLTKPLDNTASFVVYADLGRCMATDTVLVSVADYPKANAGSDTMVCRGRPLQLQGQVVADSFYWTGPALPRGTGLLQPLVQPTASAPFHLTAVNKTGCREPVTDTVRVTVVERPAAFAGNDTVVLFGQPLQLHATGGNRYEWFPPVGLSNPAVANPVLSPSLSVDQMRYTVRAFVSPDCFAEDDILIRFFKAPGIYVPSAFTPNGDGKNDSFFPVLAGMKELNRFAVFNRWGNEAFSTKTSGAGWDGRVRSRLQPAGTFVYLVEATDYTGRKWLKTGVVTLLQ